MLTRFPLPLDRLKARPGQALLTALGAVFLILIALPLLTLGRPNPPPVAAPAVALASNALDASSVATDTATPTSTATPVSTPTPTPFGGLCVLVFADLNGDGVYQPNWLEYPLPGALINVYGAGVPITRTTDGSEPVCYFVPPGSYRVTEQNPPGWGISTTPDDVSPTVVAGSNTDVFFGDQQGPTPTATATVTPGGPTFTPTPTPTATPSGDLCVLVFNDMNGDRQWKEPEWPLAGALITVTNLSGATVATYTALK